jgi:hypothetical protein
MLRVNALLLFLLVSPVSGGTEKHPSAEDINNLNELAKQTTNTFYRQSFKIRMRYEFAGRFFCEDDRFELFSLSQGNSQKLTGIINQLEKIVRQIELYYGADWEQRFGQTGLYRNSSNYLLNTRLSKFGIDYYTVLASEDKEKSAVAGELLRQINSFSKAHNPFYLQLVKGKTLALLAETDANYRPKALHLFDQLYERSDTSQRLAFMASIERTRLESAQKDIEANRLARDLMNVELRNDVEILLPTAFLQRRLGKIDIYNDLLQSSEQAHAVAAGITLTWLEAGNEPANPLDAVLIAEAALQDNPEKHKEVLLKLTENNSSAHSIVNYAAALSTIETDKRLAVKLLIKASKSQSVSPNHRLDISAVEIAKQAALLAYDMYIEDVNQCEFAANAFYNYRDFAGDDIDEDIEWKFVHLHLEDFDALAGYQRLEQIRDRGGKYSQKASLWLAAEKIRTDGFGELDQRQYLLREFAESLSEPDDCIFSAEAFGLIEDTLEWFEALDLNEPAKDKVASDCAKIAEFLLGCSKDPELRFIAAECLLLKAEPNEMELRRVESAIVNLPADPVLAPVFTRCRARFSYERKDFADAAFLWAKLAEQRRFSELPNVPPNWQWWRAKYYQLECAAKAGQDSKAIVHAIDVFRATHTDMPEIWAQKLESLQKNCGG